MSTWTTTVPSPRFDGGVRGGPGAPQANLIKAMDPPEFCPRNVPTDLYRYRWPCCWTRWPWGPPGIVYCQHGTRFDTREPGRKDVTENDHPNVSD